MQRPIARFRFRFLVVSLLLPAAIGSSSTVTGDLGDVTKVGVVADGVTLNTIAIQRAIDARSAQGGGTLTFPAGRYLTGTVELKDNVTLQLEESAVLLGSANAADYRNVDPFTDGTGM